jgi:DNA segregation ATPase FtsK/SpoIIIE-like protein
MTEFILTYFFYFKFFCLAMCCGLLLGIVYYFWKLRLFTKWAERWQNWWGIVPVFSLSGKSQREWKKIDKLLKEPYQSSWKLAVLKAEAVVKKTLNFMGYAGNDFTKILEELKFRGYQNLEILFELHNMRGKIIEDKNFSLGQDKAKEIVRIYKKFWNELLNTL